MHRDWTGFFEQAKLIHPVNYANVCKLQMNDNENAMDGRDLQSIFRNRSFDPTNAIISFYGPFWCKVDFDVGAVKKGAKS